MAQAVELNASWRVTLQGPRLSRGVTNWCVSIYIHAVYAIALAFVYSPTQLKDPTPGRLPRTKNDEFLLQLSGSPAWPPPLLSGTEDEGVFGSASSSLTSLLLHGPPGVSHPWKNSQVRRKTPTLHATSRGW